MPDRKAKIETADPEITMTFELMQAMKRVYPGNTDAKRRAVLHMAMAYMDNCIHVSTDGIWLKLQ